MSILWLPDVLRDADQTVKTYDGWKTRGRPGAFAPKGVLAHHTGTTTSMTRPAPTVAMCIRGRPDLAGPLCQAVLGFDGIWHVIAAGRANHAGLARESGPIPAGDGNANYIGVEIDYSGSQDMGPLQMEAFIEGAAAILKHMGRDEKYLRGHKETSSAGKWDPGRKGSSSPEYLMGDLRAKVRGQLTPRIRYALMSGEGKLLGESRPVKDEREPRRERLRTFLDHHVRELDLELDQDRDAIVRRRRA